MKTLDLIVIIFATSPAAANWPVERPADFNAHCALTWVLCEPPVLVMVCVEDDEAPMPPTRTTPEDSTCAPGETLSIRPLVETQQKSRRLPGGFFELDVKKSD